MKILTFENMQSACTFCINQRKQKWHVRMGDAKHSKVASAYTGQSKPKLMTLTRANDLLWSIHHFWLQIQLLSNFRGFPGSSVGKESACNAGDPRSIPGSERSAGEGIGYPLQYSWVSLVAQLVKNPPAMWETWVQSLGWEDPWRREKVPIPVFWPGEFHGLCCPWGFKESGVTERLSLHFALYNFRAEFSDWTTE